MSGVPTNSKTRVMITGSNGLLGQHLIKEYADSPIELLATSFGENRLSFLNDEAYQSLDLANKDEVFNAVRNFLPDVIINAGAYTNVDGCEDEPEQCDAVNHRAVEYFMDSFKALSIEPHFIQISTDFIFNGEKRVYSETDSADPISEYGLSKWRGEEVLLNGNFKNYTIIRTSLVYGVGEALVKGNIFSWAMSKLREGSPLTIVDDQFRSPTYVNDLARACRTVQEKEIKGIINIAGPETHSMHEYIEKVAEYVNVEKSKVQPIKTEELAQKANRPAGSGLSIAKARKEFGFSPTTFEESLRELDAKS